MKRYNTTDTQMKPPVVLMVYGPGGVGKTTFASTAPKPILMDCENGAKYFGLRGISMDVALIEKWGDVEEFYRLMAADTEHETIIIDPIGELMEKLKAAMIAGQDSKLVQRDGSPSMAGWGWMKDKMRSFLKAIRDLGKHVIIIAHVEEKDDDGRMMRRPKVMTKISEELIAFVDVVGYMQVVHVDGEDKRPIYVQPSEKFEAKDRTQQLGPVVEPDFSKIIQACQGSATFKWSSDSAKAKSEAAAAPAPQSEKPAKPAKATKKTSKKAAAEDRSLLCDFDTGNGPCDAALTQAEADYSTKRHGNKLCREHQKLANSKPTNA